MTRFSAIRAGGCAVWLLLLLALPRTSSAGLKYDLRLTGGGTTATVSSVGQVVSIDLFAVVTGAAGNSAAEGFQNGFGSAMSTDGGNISGDLSATLVDPFTASGATAGVSQNLDSDGDKDLGSKLNSYSTDLLFARAGSMQPGTPIANGMEFKLATLSFTVTSIASLSNPTPIAVSYRVPSFTQPLEIAALWQVDGLAQNSNGLGGGGAPTVGTSVTIAAIPEPSSICFLALAILPLATRRRARAA